MDDDLEPVDDLEAVENDLEPIEAPPKRPETSKYQAVNTGMATFPGVKQVGAAVNTAIDFARHPSANIADTYNAWRSFQDKQSAQSQDDHPWIYGGTSAATNMAGAMATGPALAATKVAGAIAAPLSAGRALGSNQIARNAVVDLGSSVAGAADEGDVSQAGRNALVGAGVGKAFNTAVGGLVKGGGKLLSGAQNAVDDIVASFGGTRLGKALSSSDAGDAKLTSGRAQGYKEQIKQFGEFDPGPRVEPPPMDNTAARLGKASTEFRANIEPGNRSWDPKEFGDEMRDVSRKGQLDAIKSTYGKLPDRFVPEDVFADQTINRVRNTEQKIDFRKRVLSGEPQGDEERKVYDGLMASAQRDKSAGNPQKETEQMVKDMKYGDMREGDQFRFESSVLETPAADKMRTEARRVYPDWSESQINAAIVDALHESPTAVRSKTAHLGDSTVSQIPSGKEADDFRWVTDELKKRLPKEEAQRDQAFASGKANLKTNMDELFANANAAKKQINEATESTARYGEKDRLGKIADSASKKLENIKTGRSAVENITGLVSSTLGAMSDNNSSFAKTAFNASVGAMAGKPIGRAIFKGVDLAGAAGQRMAKVASIAERLATRDDSIGKAAKWALSAEGDRAVARLAILMDMPEVRAEVDQ